MENGKLENQHKKKVQLKNCGNVQTIKIELKWKKVEYPFNNFVICNEKHKIRYKFNRNLLLLLALRARSLALLRNSSRKIGSFILIERV